MSNEILAVLLEVYKRRLEIALQEVHYRLPDALMVERQLLTGQVIKFYDQTEPIQDIIDDLEKNIIDLRGNPK